MTNLSVNGGRVISPEGPPRPSRLFSNTSVSKVIVYLGNDCLSLKTPFITLFMTGCFPTVIPAVEGKLDNMIKSKKLCNCIHRSIKGIQIPFRTVPNESHDMWSIFFIIERIFFNNTKIIINIQNKILPNNKTKR